ncbi:MAG: PD-(D/E)XK nuclease family protein, partial [Ignavibacteria bacterium]
HLNLLYVSFTRAKDRLYVIVPGEVSITKDIKNVIKSVEEFSAAVKDKNLYEIGFKTPPEPLEKISSSIKTDGFNSTDFYSKLVIKPIHFGFSIAKEFESINRGLLIHRALAYIKTVSDVNSSLSHLKREGLIREGNENELKKELEEITAHQQASNWFKEGLEIKNEAELLLPDGTVLRPDRIVIDKSKATVIDFKTGEEHPEHKTQIKIYGNALEAAGFDRVEKYLFYIGERKVVEV